MPASTCWSQAAKVVAVASGGAFSCSSRGSSGIQDSAENSLTLPRELDEAAELDGCGKLGIYWRILPPSLVLRALRRWAERGQTAVLYMHPWELDLEQPVAEVGWADWLIHYANLASSVRMIERVLAACSFDSIRDRVLNQPVERYHLHDGRLRRAASASTSRG